MSGTGFVGRFDGSRGEGGLQTSLGDRLLKGWKEFIKKMRTICEIVSNLYLINERELVSRSVKSGLPYDSCLMPDC